jgi:hypothetical protein
MNRRGMFQSSVMHECIQEFRGPAGNTIYSILDVQLLLVIVNGCFTVWGGGSVCL